MNAGSTTGAVRAPVTLRTLGALEVTGPGGEPLAELLARPKPLGVLLHLALAGGEGFQRRDTLLALFWPESDDARARSSLRQALRRLRGALGADAIVSRGDDVGLGAGAVWCDAREFERRVELGDLPGALDLHRGDLLPGFHVEGAPAFEEWLGQRRRALRDSASSVARALLEAADRAGDAEAALAWCRRAASLAPDDEAAVRRLVSLLARTGDRAGAVREYEAFARRLRDEHGLRPSAETTALVSRVREGGAQDGAPPLPLDERRVLVTAFENDTGEPSLDALGRLVADSVAGGAARLEGVSVVPLAAAFASAHDATAAASRTRGPARARRMAEATGAGTVVSGAYYAAGGDLVLQGWIGDARTGDALLSLGPVRAPLADPLRAVDAIRAAAVTGLARRLETRVLHVRATGRTASFEAHDAYVEGQARFVDGDWTGALRHLERAVASDPTYALPRIVAAIAHWNLGDLARAEAAAEGAAPLVAAAGPFERALLDMVRAWLAGDWGAAYDAVRRQSELAPGSIASFQMAEEARRRNRPREALRLLGAMDPSRGEMRGWVFYWVVMAQALHMLGEHARELEVARRARALHPESAVALRLEVHARAALGDAAGVHACIEERLATPSRGEPSPGTLMREAAHELLAHGHRGPDADRLLRQSLAWYEELPAGERACDAVRRATARARYDAGDWEGARSVFAGLAADRVTVADCGSVHHPHLQAHLDHGYLGAIAIRCGDVVEAARIDRMLEEERGPYLFGSTHYWRAAMAGLRGDAEVAARLLRRAFAGGMPYEPFVHADPHLAAVRGDPAVAAVLAPRG